MTKRETGKKKKKIRISTPRLPVLKKKIKNKTGVKTKIKVEETIEMTKPASTVSINNPTEATYQLHVDNTPYTIKPGLNSGFELITAKQICRDLNKDVPGDNNLFTVE